MVDDPVVAKEMKDIRRFWNSVIALHAKHPFIVVSLTTRDELATAAMATALSARGFESPVTNRGRWWARRVWSVSAAKRAPNPLTQDFMASVISQAVEAGTASNARFDGVGAAPEWPRSAA